MDGLCQDCLGRLALGTALAPENSPALEVADDFADHLTEPPGALEPVSARRIGDYELLELIGRGGMGSVYRARQVTLHRTVAVKMIQSAAVFADENAVKRFHVEAGTIAMLDHPNIVTLYEVGLEGDHHYFSMKLVEGGSLSGQIARYSKDVTEAAKLVATVARAVHYAHQCGVIHRDLKPANILIDARGEPFITDFGLAKHLRRDDELTLSTTVLGTPAFMAPEQAAGKGRTATTVADVYSLGAILYNCLTGCPPFHAETLIETLRQVVETEPARPSAVNPKVDSDLETICLKCLEKSPAARYASAQDLAEDLERWLRHEPIEARRIGSWGRTLRWARRKPTLAALLLATSLAVAALLVTLTLADLRVRSAHRVASAAAEENRQRLVRLNVFTGNRLVEDGDAFGALVWFVEALRLEGGVPTREAVHRRRLACVLRAAPKLVQLWNHDGFTYSAEFSPDGNLVVSSSLDKTARVWDVHTGQSIGPPIVHDNIVWGALFTPDGQRVVTASADGKLRFWDKGTGQLSREPLATATHDVEFADFSPDGRWLAATAPGEIKFFNATNGEPTEINFPIDREFRKVRFSKDGRWIAAFGQSSGVWFWDAASRQRIFEAADLPGEVPMLSFSPNNQYVLANLGRRSVHLQNLQTGRNVWPPMKTPEDLFDCRFSPDGRWLVTASWNGQVRLFDAETGHSGGPPMQHQTGVRWSVFSPDGRTLATASWDHTARLWNPLTGKPVSPALHHAGYVSSVRFSPDSRQVVTASQDQTVRLWDLATNGSARVVVRHDAAVRYVEFSPDGSRFLTCSLDKRARLWEAASGRLLLSLDHDHPVAAGDFSPNGDRVATGCADGSVHIWDTQTGVGAVPPFRHSQRIQSVQFSPDGRRLVTASADGTARIWDVATGNPVTGRLEQRGRILRAIFSPDGRSVVTAGEDAVAQLWDARTGERIGPALSHDCEVHWAAFSPDGTRLVTASSDRTELARAAFVWDTATGKRIGPPLSHRDGVFFADFSPNGRLIATSGEDRVAIIWDVLRLQPIAPALRHLSYVHGVFFSPDSALVLTIDSGGTARVWEAITGEPITPSLAHGDSVRTGAWRPDGQEVITGSEDGAVRIFDVSPFTMPLARLRAEAELLAASRLDAEIGAVPLTLQEMNERWRALRTKPAAEAKRSSR
ncbi:MAG: protein kinase [Verrucomicrobiales bacterium]|nr:protein kinase [Verrucomicrobiales bacterium]